MNEYLLLPLLLVGSSVLFVVFVQHALAGGDREAGEAQFPPPIAPALLGICGALGIFLRLYGVDRSLWLDEFGTRWAVEGSLNDLLMRVWSFHGQSPLYYTAVWGLTSFAGESEIAMRSFSLALGAGTAWCCYKLGKHLFGSAAACAAAVLYWLSPAAVEMEAQARPYALALLMATLMLYGFARAVRNGDRSGRWLFVCGGLGLFWAQYILALAALGLAVAYVMVRPLREHYPFRQFAFDALMQGLPALLSVPHILSLWNRRGMLEWLGRPNPLVFFELAGPFLIAALIPLLLRLRGRLSPYTRAMVLALWIWIVTQAGLLYLLAFLDINLLHPRYLVVVVIPMVLLAGAALARLPPSLTIAPIGYWLFFAGVMFGLNFHAHGSFSRAGFQDWAGAVACLNRQQAHPESAILYRSGFVEEDQMRKEAISSAVFAPLRGLALANAPIIQLTYSWNERLHEEYFARVVVPVLARAQVFYFLTCAGCFNERTGQYPRELTSWVERRFGDFERIALPAGRGITLYRFARMPPASPPLAQGVAAPAGCGASGLFLRRSRFA